MELCQSLSLSYFGDADRNTFNLARHRKRLTRMMFEQDDNAPTAVRKWLDRGRTELATLVPAQSPYELVTRRFCVRVSSTSHFLTLPSPVSGPVGYFLY